MRLQATRQANTAQSLRSLFHDVRQHSLTITASLGPEDQTVQTMPDVSPTKWHLAHTSWFFETFILGQFITGYRPFDPEYEYLFNSYYNGIGAQYPRDRRGLMTRPGLDEIHAYRRHVDGAIANELGSSDTLPDWAELLVLGCHHEQQHQELMQTDIKHVLSQNMRRGVLASQSIVTCDRQTSTWVDHPGGLVEIGNEDNSIFHFDNEGPRHKVWLEPFEMCSTLVTNGQYLAFMADSGYERPELWLSEGWAAVQHEQWRAPLYWVEGVDGAWQTFAAHGLQDMDPEAPVIHVSYLEADAYARWAQKRLPLEAEWEVLASDARLLDLHGTAWQWTNSAYAPYPRYQAAAGTVGEYNGKFMNSQMVLRGSSSATPNGHARDTYRNFFYPRDRWQFAGIRLANYK
jgi:ergothioneine biosynthesis protein EgtB